MTPRGSNKNDKLCDKNIENCYMTRSKTLKTNVTNKPVKKFRLEEAPNIKYEGKIVYKTTFADCAQICEDLLVKVTQSPEETFVLGFDLEWYFSFKNGAGKVSVIQISPNLNVCYVLQLGSIKYLPKSLTELITHDKTRLAGVMIKNDIRKLHRDFPGFNVDKALENCIDLSTFANSFLPYKQRWSLEKLVNEFFKMNINKDKSVRMSKWHVIPLTKEQQIYAAIDAYASLKLFLQLKALKETYEKEAAEEINQLKTSNEP